MNSKRNSETEFPILRSRIAALEQLIEVYEDSVVEQADKLYAEISERRRAEGEVRLLNEELEQRVRERTAELEAVNLTLTAANRQLREKEAALQENRDLLLGIVDNSMAVIYVKNLLGRYLLVNRRFEELFHVRRETLAGKTDYDVFPREQAEAFRAVDERVLAAESVVETEEVAPQDDGLHTYISIKAPLRDAVGTPYALCGISTDITGRKQNEEEIRSLNAELQQKIEELMKAQEVLIRTEKLAILGQLSGSVGNELRNPLGVMNNAVFFLQTIMPDADETVTEYLEILKREIDNSQRTITDFLDAVSTPPLAKS